MSVIVTKQVTLSQNLPNDLIGKSINHTNWEQLTNIGSSDNLYATADFADGTGDNVSNFLHLHTFKFDVPGEIGVDGIELIVEKSGIGSVQDLQLRLTWDDVSIKATTPKSIAGNWPASDATSVYGSSSDTWNTKWTDVMINSNNFGAIVAVTGTLGTSAAFIDTATITLYYHRVFVETGGDGTSDGAVCGGTAEVQVSYETGEGGGVGVIGDGSLIETEIGIGGIVVAGEAFVQDSIYGSGGVVIDATMDRNFVFSQRMFAGITSGGTASVEMHEGPEGGVTVSGSAHVTSSLYAQGGVVLSSLALEETIYGFNPEGGLRAGGTAFVDPTIATGGATLSGEAIESFVYNIESDVVKVGVGIGGTVLISHSATGTGGLTILEKPAGKSLGYTPESVTKNIPNWSFGLDASQIVPPEFEFGELESEPLPPSDGFGYAEMWLATLPKDDPPFAGRYLFGWWITYENLSSAVIDVTFNGPANPDENGGQAFSLFAWNSTPPNSLKPIGDFYSPIHGQIFLTPKEMGDIIGAKGWYITIKTENYPTGEIRGQLTQDGITLSGKAVLNPIFAEGGIKVGGIAIDQPYLNLGIGSTVVSGTSEVNSSNQKAGTGGVKLGGFANIGVTRSSVVASGGIKVSVPPINPGTGLDDKVQWIFRPLIGETTSGVVVSGNALRADKIPTRGGVRVRGTAIIEQTFMGPRGGVVCGGSAVVKTTLTIVAEGGVEISGLTLIIIGYIASGGIQVAGDPVLKWTINPVLSGGVDIGGAGNQTFIDQVFMEGGLRVSPKSRVEKIKPLLVSPAMNGIAYALKSPNIINSKSTTGSLILTHITPAPVLDENRFRIKHLPTWCDFVKSNDIAQKEDPNCDAGLAKNIQTRQRGILPSRSGRKQVIDTNP